MSPHVQSPPGKEREFAEATRPLFAHLVSTARRVLGDDDMSWDAVQEALISLWRERQFPSDPRAWLVAPFEGFKIRAAPQGKQLS